MRLLSSAASGVANYGGKARSLRETWLLELGFKGKFNQSHKDP